MKVNKKLVDKAILEIKILQHKYSKAEVMFIYHGLDEALNYIGWAYSEMLNGGSPELNSVIKRTDKYV